MSAAWCAAWFVGTWLAIGAGWAIIRATAWARRHLTAADQWIRNELAEDGSHIDDDELADWLAIEEADYQAETDYNPQAGLQRLRDEINKQQREEGQ